MSVRVGAALAGVRVIDIAGPLGELAGRVLADLGAEVLKVEPPEGTASRRLPPFASDNHESLYWAAVGRGKRSCVLALDERADRARLAALLDDADILIETLTPAQATAWRLEPARLADQHPRLVHVSVTPYGRSGPRASAPASDLTLEAAGGLLGLQGDGDRPPLPIGFPQASFHAGVQAATDALIALYARRANGRGQHLDTSAQQAMVWTLMNATGYFPMTGADPPGTGEGRATPAEIVPGVRLPRTVGCRDGYVAVGLTVPGIGEKTMALLLGRALDAGPDDRSLREVDFGSWLAPLREGRLAPALAQHALARVIAWIAQQSKRELQALATSEGVLIAAIHTPAELFVDPQLESRGFWTNVGGRLHPGPFARLSATPLRCDVPAPVLAQSGVDNVSAFVGVAPRRAMGPSQPTDTAVRAFAGLKVADFSWVGVGPMIARALADHGATVVHVESATRPDVLRNLPPFLAEQRGLDRAHFMANFNTSKLGLALDLRSEVGLAVARDLVGWADVLIESFTPGTMAKFGLDEATLRPLRPDLVTLSTCMRGQTGPERRYSGFGNQGASLAGFVAITGWPDRPPHGPWGAYTDFITPRYGIAALVAALHHRADTGEGQNIDLSQIEAGIQFMEPLLLDCAEHGRDAPAMGHYSLYASPHGVFACAGRERYLALSVHDTAQWRALAGALGDARWQQAQYDSEPARRLAATDITAAIGALCAGRDAFALAAELCQRGVPAAAVLRPMDLYTDAQLAHRGHFVRLRHAVMGEVPFDGLATRFSNALSGPFSAAPMLGEHSMAVLREVLGYDATMVDALTTAGVLQ